jgi:hypothetical protein
MSLFNAPLKLAHPYGGKCAKSVSLGSNSAKNFSSSFRRKPKGMLCPRSSFAMTRNVRPPADFCPVGNVFGCLIERWMCFPFWSMVMRDFGTFSWSMVGRTRETRDEALELAEAVCSESTVVLWAMHALSEISHDLL